MNPLRIDRAVRWLGVALILIMPALVQAEVGATEDPGSPEEPSTHFGPNPYVLGAILEDPEPIGTIWIPYNEDSPSRFVLNRQGYENGDGDPSIAVNPVSREVMVAWGRNSASGYDVVLSRLETDGWSEPIVLAGSAADELDPHLTVDPDDGTVHLFYWVDGARVVMHRQAPADLSAWSDPVQASQAGEEASRPGGVVHGGELYVTYERHDFGFSQTPRNIVLARRDGADFVPEVVAVTSHAGEVRPQVHSKAGRLWVDWIDSDNEAAWTRSQGTGQWEPILYEPYNSTEERDYHVRGAIRLQAIQ